MMKAPSGKAGSRRRCGVGEKGVVNKIPTLILTQRFTGCELLSQTSFHSFWEGPWGEDGLELLV